jgi:hypothetical protein
MKHLENPSDIWSLKKIWSGVPNFDILERCFLSSVLDSTSISEPKKWSEEIASEPQKSEDVNMDHVGLLVGSIIFVDPCATTNHNTFTTIHNKKKHRDVCSPLRLDAGNALSKGTWNVSNWSPVKLGRLRTEAHGPRGWLLHPSEILWDLVVASNHIQIHSISFQSHRTD